MFTTLKPQIMKFKTTTTLLVLLSLFISCNAVEDLLTFTIKNSTTITIESLFPIGSPFEAATPDVTTNSSTSFENNKTQASLVKDVKLNSLKLTITAPETKNFSFLKTIRLYISAENVEEMELASAENVNSTSNTLNLTCTSSNLDQYLKKDKYTIRTEVTTKETITTDINVKIDMTYKVTANPF